MSEEEREIEVRGQKFRYIDDLKEVLKEKEVSSVYERMKEGNAKPGAELFLPDGRRFILLLPEKDEAIRLVDQEEKVYEEKREHPKGLYT